MTLLRGFIWDQIDNNSGCPYSLFQLKLRFWPSARPVIFFVLDFQFVRMFGAQGKAGLAEATASKFTDEMLALLDKCRVDESVRKLLLGKEIFEPLGWDRKPNESTEKHYRKFFTEELEKVNQVMSKESEF